MKRRELLDFCDWWRHELRQLAKPIFGQKNSRAAPATVVVFRDQCLVYRNSARDEELLEGVSSRSVGERIQKTIGSDTCHVRLSAERFIKRSLSQNRLPFGRAMQMAKIDLAEATPFSADDVYICLPNSHEKPRGTSYFIVRKTILDPVLDSLRDAGIRPSSLGFSGSDGVETIASTTSAGTIRASFRSKSYLSTAIAASSLVLFFSIGATGAHAYLRYANAAQELQQQIDSKQNKAIEVRRILERREGHLAMLEATRRSKAESVPIVRVWEELTQLIPDTAWLTDLEIRENRVTFSGFSPMAASLIQPIEGSPLFRETNFASPVTKVPGQTGERFVINTVIER